jgi:tetratricopeptide (TPR) repeat protein
MRYSPAGDRNRLNRTLASSSDGESHKWVTTFAICIATVLLYIRVWRFPFINLDDPDYVAENRHVQEGVSLDSLKWAMATTECSNWHPFTWVSHQIDVEILGLYPGLMHGENALIHAASAAVLFLLLLEITIQYWPSVWVALMFALHPLHVESVAWISERKDVLSTLFMMLSLISYARYAQAERLSPYLLSLLFFALGLMAKPMLVTLPCLMLLLDFWPLRRNRRPQRLVVEKIPMMLAAFGSSIAAYLAQSHGRAVATIQEIPLRLRLANALIAYTRYLRLTLAPFDLAVFYPHVASFPGGSISTAAIMVSAIVLLAISLAAIAGARRMPWILVGWLWYLGTLVPVIGFVQVGKQAMADRYTYVPLIGIFIAVAWTAAWLVESRRGRVRIIIGSLAIASLLYAGALAWRQVGFWRDSETLMRHAAEVVPNNYLALGNLGNALEDRGDAAGAERAYRQAIHIRPNDSTSLYRLAIMTASRGETDQAIEFYGRGIAADPTIAAAFNNYGNLLRQRGRDFDAIAAYRRAIEMDPSMVQACHSLAMILARQEKSDEAIALWQKAIDIDPAYIDARFRLGQMHVMKGRAREGMDEMRLAVKAQSTRWDLVATLAWILATRPEPEVQNGEEAIRFATSACRLTQDSNPTCLDARAAAEARVGRFVDAAATAQIAASLADQHALPDLAKEIRGRAEVYGRGQAYSSTTFRQ